MWTTWFISFILFNSLSGGIKRRPRPTASYALKTKLSDADTLKICYEIIRWKIQIYRAAWRRGWKWTATFSATVSVLEIRENFFLAKKNLKRHNTQEQQKKKRDAGWRALALSVSGWGARSDSNGVCDSTERLAWCPLRLRSTCGATIQRYHPIVPPFTVTTAWLCGSATTLFMGFLQFTPRFFFCRIGCWNTSGNPAPYVTRKRRWHLNTP